MTEDEEPTAHDLAVCYTWHFISWLDECNGGRPDIESIEMYISIIERILR